MAGPGFRAVKDRSPCCPAARTWSGSGRWTEAQHALSWDSTTGGRYLLFPAAPGRQVKRHDRAQQVAELAEAELLTGGDIDAERMPLWMNAASAALVPSEYEGFGLVAVEALGCDLPVLSTPVGIAPALLAGIDGTLATPFDASTWSKLARAHVEGEGRIRGRRRALWFAAGPMADRVAVAYSHLIGRDDRSPADLA